ncbi:FAD-dependent oxidoreductase [Christensenellaceae bacterium OttesenSCG-928-K19]|nr:FAD-dependent oxidoreductase [Christensenellaceae bacterium OttesenSCG-928-K19]
MYNLTEEQKKKLTDIVGEENIATQPWLRDTYGIWFASPSTEDGNIEWAARPAAIITPETTEQVQAITQYCNETDLMVHPTSTGQIVAGAATAEKTLLLDLCKMNTIVELDADNMTAVVEPFVRSLDLQLQAWPKQCNPYVISVGAVGSTLAAATSHTGYGQYGPSCGYGPRTILGLEWVMPDGDVIQIGSAGQKAGWFTTAGPGPDLLGVMRGFNGAMGGLGTYTKAAIKMGPWYGPKEIGDENLSFECKMPRFVMHGKLPENVAFRAVSFPTMEAFTEAHYRVNEEYIPYAEKRVPAFLQSLAGSSNSYEHVKVWESGYLQKINRYMMSVMIIGANKEECEWKEKAFDIIVAEEGGIRMPKVIRAHPDIYDDIVKLFHDTPNKEDYKKLQQDIQARIDAIPYDEMSHMAASASISGTMRNVDIGMARPGALFTLGGNLDTWDAGLAMNRSTVEQKTPLVRAGGILDDDIDTGCGNPYEGGHLGYTENIFFINRNDASGSGARALAQATGKNATNEIKEGFSSFTISFGMNNERFGPLEYDYHIWTKRIKKLLDPNDSCDSTTYSGLPNHKEVKMNG